MAGLTETLAKSHPNKAELACMIVLLEAALRLITEDVSKELEDVMREVAKEVKLVRVKPQHDQNHEEREDAQADITMAMDQEDVEDAEKQSEEAPEAAGRT